MNFRDTLIDQVVANRMVKALPTILELCALMRMTGKWQEGLVPEAKR